MFTEITYGMCWFRSDLVWLHYYRILKCLSTEKIYDTSQISSMFHLRGFSLETVASLDNNTRGCQMCICVHTSTPICAVLSIIK